MATKLNKGRMVILAMFAVVAVYAGSLVLMNEPTPWRDIPEEGMSRNGLAFSDEIAEMRLYHMPRRGFPFYFVDERAHYEPLARVGDPATIEAILTMLAPGEPPTEPGCAPVKRDAMLHVITQRADGSVFGYVVLQAGRITAAGPADAKDCTIAWFHQRGEFTSRELYDARARLSEMTGVAM
ncbi:MAG: hypothetical protein IMF05_05290 [Proteobacteria bacterium]|nr:hypothetical protein [Pseudomonadota bacterium]